MIKIENMEVYGWDAAIGGMRNSWNSWKCERKWENDGKTTEARRSHTE